MFPFVHAKLCSGEYSGKVWYTQTGSSYSGVWNVMGVSGIYPTFAAGNVKRCAK